MNDLKLRPIKMEEKSLFIKEIQETFQNSYEKEYGECKEMILPTTDIVESFDTEGAEIYFAEIDGNIVGGTVIAVNKETQYNELHLLYVKVNSQNCGMGKKIWDAIEKLHPNTKIWETHTPYYDKRNIHFYVNRCGFKIMEFFNQKHRDPHQKEDSTKNSNDFFRFEKEMK